MATLGGAAGAAIRQFVDAREAGDAGPRGELTIAASPTPIVAGTVAGLLLPRWKAAAAFIVGANVGANLRDDPLSELLGSVLDKPAT